MSKMKISGVKSFAFLPVVRNDRQRELLKRVHQGDKEAREELITGSLRLVVSVVSRYFRGRENADDLFQTGCIGLIKAVDRYDFRQNVVFSTYATRMIFGEIQNYLRSDSYVRVSRLLWVIAYKAIKATDRLTNFYQRTPTIAEIAVEIKEAEGEVRLALGIFKKPMSLYQSAYVCDDKAQLMDLIENPKSNGDEWIFCIALKDGMAHLTEREKNVIQKRFWGDKTQKETAKELEMSQPQVCRDERNALRKLKMYVI
ncbi:MAG: sigma-70 family RNA polymerase sigma factor [Clostridia bacterium]|nr:sigma-70 family RNA polymerase sigma factor [Clostridia bacterium]